MLARRSSTKPVRTGRGQTGWECRATPSRRCKDAGQSEIFGEQDLYPDARACLSALGGGETIASILRPAHRGSRLRAKLDPVRRRPTRQRCWRPTAVGRATGMIRRGPGVTSCATTNERHAVCSGSPVWPSYQILCAAKRVRLREVTIPVRAHRTQPHRCISRWGWDDGIGSCAVAYESGCM